MKWMYARMEPDWRAKHVNTKATLEQCARHNAPVKKTRHADQTVSKEFVCESKTQKKVVPGNCNYFQRTLFLASLLSVLQPNR